MLTIQLLGNPQVFLDGQLVHIPRRKSRALLFYLAAHIDPCPREVLLAFFWPDLERSAGQQVLRTSLHGLRELLGQALLIERNSVALAGDAQVDVRQLEQRLDPLPAGPAALEDGLALYRGEFLQGFTLPDSEEFERWLTVEREHYRKLVLRSLAELSRLYELRHDYPAALSSLERALKLDALQEDLQRDVIRLLYLSGDRAGAIRRYDSLRKLLDEELGVPPMAETRALYDDILNDRLEAPPAPVKMAPPQTKLRPPESGLLPFTSRTQELAALNEEIFSGRLILLEGEAGIGKTRLAEHFLNSLDVIVLSGAGRELEQSLLYHPVVEALHTLFTHPGAAELIQTVRQELPGLWLAETARLLPELDPHQPAFSTDEWRLWEGVSQFLQILSRLKPVVLFLDDLQWADAPTIGLLGYLVRHTAGEHTGFLGTVRQFSARTPLAHLVQALTRERRLVRHPLDRFSLADIQAVASQISPDFATILSGWLAQTSEGNPYILTEMVRDARRRGILTADGTVNLTLLSGGSSVPYTVYTLIQSRLANLSDEARRLLDAAAAVGRDFEFDVAARASGLPEDRALDALDEALRAGIVLPQDDGRYRFDHSLTVEVASQQTGEERRRYLHRSVAAAYETVSPQHLLEKNPGLLAYHYLEGRDTGRAAPYAEKAGQQAAAFGAWREAAVFYEQALSGAVAARRYPLLVELGWALMRSGQAARAAEIFDQALDQAAKDGDLHAAASARIALAQSYLPQSRFSEAVAAVHKVLALDDPSLNYQAELWWGTALSLEGSDLDEAEQHLTRAAELCQKCAGPVALAQVEFELGSIAAQKGNLELAVKQYRKALENASQEDTPPAIEQRVLSHNNLAYHLFLLGDPSAESYGLAGLKLARENGVLSYQVYLYSTLGEIALGKKQYDQAERWFNLGLDLAHQVSVPERVAGLTANLGLLAVARGQTSLAIHRLSAAMAQSDALGIRHLAAQIRIWLAPLLPAAEARTLLSEARQIAESGGRRRLLEEVEAVENLL